MCLRFYLISKKSPARTSKLIFNQFVGYSSYSRLFNRQTAAIIFHPMGLPS